MLLFHVENTKSPYCGEGGHPARGRFAARTTALCVVVFFIPMKILIFWPKYLCLDVRILKMENQTWQLCINQHSLLRPKKKNCYVALTRSKIWKLGRSVEIFFFFFFLRTVRELSFPIFFLKFLNGENSGGMQSKRIYKSCKCFFKPLNTNFSKFFAQIWHKKKTRPCFFAFYGRLGEGNINIFFFGLIEPNVLMLEMLSSSNLDHISMTLSLYMSKNKNIMKTWRVNVWEGISSVLFQVSRTSQRL